MLETLKAELDADPLTRGYATMTDAEAAASLNTANITIREWVENWRLKQAVIEFQAWGFIVLTAQDVTASTPIRVLCINVRDWIDDRTGQIIRTDMDRESVQLMLGGLIGAGFITVSQGAELVSLGNKTISRAEQLGLGTISAVHVRDAKGLS